MARRAVLLAGLAAALAAPVAAHGAEPDRNSPAAKRLVAFRSCDALVRYARRHGARTVEAGGLPGRPVAQPAPFPPPTPPQQDPGGVAQPVAGAPEAGRDFSQTNVQEAGVDEPDIVKSDGARIFVASGFTVHAVEVIDGRPRLAGSLLLPSFGNELLLHGDRLLVLGSGSAGPQPMPVEGRSASSVVAPDRGVTVLTEIDVRDPSAMRILRTLEAEGSFVGARLRGATARVAISSPPRPADVQSRGTVRRSRLRTWMPARVLENRRTGRRARRRLLSCRAVRRPARFSGLGMLAVLTIDLERGLPPVDSDGLMTDAQTVYASPRSLYVATERWVDPSTSPERVPSGRATAIHRFDASEPSSTTYRASGEVLGYLLNHWSLSEYRGVLRVASTSDPVWLESGPPADSESQVTVLDERAGRLAEVGRVGGLGRGERIYAVRFIDDVGFVVTFRQVDPLFTIDLSNPERPRVLGELELLGYSAYLHPIERDLLLGVGQDATPEGRTRGAQLSLFDVSDLRNPVRLHQRTLGTDTFTEVEGDHRAFLFWPATSLAVLPLQSFPADEPGFVGAAGFRVDRAGGIAEVGRVAHEGGTLGPPIRRALVVGDRLYTVSDAGVRASRLDTLDDVAWAPFPR